MLLLMIYLRDLDMLNHPFNKRNLDDHQQLESFSYQCLCHQVRGTVECQMSNNTELRV